MVYINIYILPQAQYSFHFLRLRFHELIMEPKCILQNCIHTKSTSTHQYQPTQHVSRSLFQHHSSLGERSD